MAVDGSEFTFDYWRHELDVRRARLQEHAVDPREAESGGRASGKDAAVRLIEENGDNPLARALFRIEAALWRLREGLFGRCIDCNDPLEISRLLVEPTVSRCLSCQRDLDASRSPHCERSGG